MAEDNTTNSFSATMSNELSARFSLEDISPSPTSSTKTEFDSDHSQYFQSVIRSSQLRRSRMSQCLGRMRRTSKYKFLKRREAMGSNEFRFLTVPSARLIETQGLHRLESIEAGNSSVELLAARVEKRRAERVHITTTIRTRFVHHCQNTARRKTYANCENCIQLEDIKELRDLIQAKLDCQIEVYKKLKKILKYFDIQSNDQYMLEVLNKAISVITKEQAPDDTVLRLDDFFHYHTKVLSPSLCRRHKLLNAAVMIFTFYLFTPVIFCVLAQDEGVCPEDHTTQDRWYYGWVSSFYFASATLTTVGYGELTVSKDVPWKLFLGIFYMICSTLLMVFFFSTSIDEAITLAGGGFHNKIVKFIMDPHDKIMNFIMGEKNREHPDKVLLHKKVRRMWLLLVSEITLQFTVLNLIGLFVSRVFVTNCWTWMESLYWVIQTTTTIGYGDLPMPFEMRWFNIVFLLVGTCFVGNSLGRLGQIKVKIKDCRRLYIWKRRELNKSMIKDIKQSDDEQLAAVDQFEYAISSLLDLGKISSEDIKPIMEKFRDMATVSDDPGLLEVESCSRQFFSLNFNLHEEEDIIE